MCCRATPQAPTVHINANRISRKLAMATRTNQRDLHTYYSTLPSRTHQNPSTPITQEPAETPQRPSRRPHNPRNPTKTPPIVVRQQKVVRLTMLVPSDVRYNTDPSRNAARSVATTWKGRKRSDAVWLPGIGEHPELAEALNVVILRIFADIRTSITRVFL